MTGSDQIIRRSTAGAVVGVAAVASYEHAYVLVRAEREAYGRKSRQSEARLSDLDATVT